jgi:hypothetical protein
MYREATSSQLPECLVPGLPGSTGRRPGWTAPSRRGGPARDLAPEAPQPRRPRGEVAPMQLAELPASTDLDRRPLPASIGDVGDDLATTGVRWKGFLVARAAAPQRDPTSPGALLARRWGADPWPATS